MNDPVGGEALRTMLTGVEVTYYSTAIDLGGTESTAGRPFLTKPGSIYDSLCPD